MAKFCIHCGAPVNETDLFCGNCGAKIASSEVPAPSAEPDLIREENVAGEPVAETSEVPYAQPVFHSSTAPKDETEPSPAPAEPDLQDGYQQATYQQTPYPQNAYPQNAYPQNAYPQNTYPQNGYQQPYPAQQPKKKHTGLIIGIIIAVVVFLGLIIGGIMFVIGLVGYAGSGSSNATISSGGNSGSVSAYSDPEDVVEAYYDTVEGVMTGSSSVNDLISLSYEVAYIKPDYKSEIEDTLIDSYGDLSLGGLSSVLGENFRIEYRIDDVITMSVADREDFIEENDLSEYCETSSIEEMCRVKSVMTMQSALLENDIETDGDEAEIVCIKADGRWYISFISIE
jgi:hypothetical protein